MSERLGERGRQRLTSWRRLAPSLEIFEKRGRRRGFELAAGGERFAQSVEAGWAVRGGDAQSSWFVAGSGELPEQLAPPPAGSPGLHLPPRSARAPALPPRDLDAPLATESEGRALMAGVARELVRELPDVSPPTLLLEEGSSESALISSEGVVASWRGRSAVLRVDVSRGGVRVEAEFVARAANELKPLALARRLADRLLALEGSSPPSAPKRFVLAPPVAARLVEALAPRFVGLGARARLAELLDRDGRLGSPAVTLIDDGSLAAGAMAAPYDGEGVPTGAVRLVGGGRFERPLVAARESEAPAEAAGCTRRDGWRDVPRTGPSQLFLAPEPRRTVVDLVAEASAGVYLISVEGGVALTADGESFSVPVSGFALAEGRGAGALGRCRLVGSFRDLLRGVRSVARDLAFVPGDGLFGAPTLLVEGLELRGAD